MRHLFLFLPILLLSACDLMKAPTPAESVWFSTLARWEVASAYERYCIKPEKPTANIVGNAQIIVASLAGELAKRVEGKSEDYKMKIVDQLIRRRIDPVRGKLDRLFLEKGCNSQEATEAKPLYVVFSQTHPAQMHQIVVNQIKKEKSAQP